MSVETKMEDVVCIAFDVEATGMRPSVHALVELGAAAGTQALGTLTSFSAKMAIPRGHGFDKACELEFWDAKVPEKKKQVLGCTVSPEDVMLDFVAWVEGVLKNHAGGNMKRVRFISDNVAFDAKWVSHYLDVYADHEPLETFFEGKFQPLCDVNAYRRGTMCISPDDELEYSRVHNKRFSTGEQVRGRLGITKRGKTKANHTAVDDANSILEEWFILLNHFREKRQK